MPLKTEESSVPPYCQVRCDVNSISGKASYGPTSHAKVKICQRKTEGSSLLHLACLIANAGMVELLLQYGANINASDSRGQTLLHYSIIRGKTATAKLLVARRAKQLTPPTTYITDVQKILVPG